MFTVFFRRRKASGSRWARGRLGPSFRLPYFGGASKTFRQSLWKSFAVNFVRDARHEMVIDQGYNSFEVRPGRRHPLPFNVVAERMPNCELIAARANGHFSVVSDLT
jgi:hypothetical protein